MRPGDVELAPGSGLYVPIEQLAQFREEMRKVDFEQRRPPSAVDSERKAMPTDEIRAKLIEMERLDQCYRFTDIRKLIKDDQDIAAWWVYWVYQLPFVWRFIFAHTVPGAPHVNEDGHWLRNTFKATIGDHFYQKKLSDTKEQVEASGDRIELCV